MGDSVGTADMVTLDEAARLFGVARGTMYRYVQQGKVKTYRRAMDKRTYVSRSDVEALRQFRPTGRHSAYSALKRAADFRRRVFGGSALTTSSADLIDEDRRERTAALR